MTRARLCLPILLLALTSVSQAQAQPVHVEGLGAIDFPNSGAPEAQEAFIRGTLLLHSFEFGPARSSFRQAQELDEGFALAYWGEAMAHNYPLWQDRDLDDGRAVLGRLGPDPATRRSRAGTEREAMYLDAVEELYADGTKAQQDLAYMEAMARLHAAYPDDDEARTFYALSILGSVDGERDFATYMRGAAMAAPVFQRNPLHPGAAHYLIHSFDDPVHAPLGLPAAEAYANIAPDAAHAQHMTTHIFVAMGMWERVVEANIRAMSVQDAQRAAAGNGPNTCGHYSSWRHYGHLMLGEYQEAEGLMDACHADVQAGRGNRWYFAQMRARHVVDTQDWALAERWLEDGDMRPGNSPGFLYAMTNALAGVMQGRPEKAQALLELPRDEDAHRSLQLDQLKGLALLKQNATTEGLALIRAAAEAEAALPFEFGPPVVAFPGYELLAHTLETAGLDARDAYREAALRAPGRPLAQSPETAHGSH